MTLSFLPRNLKKCPSFIKNSCYKSLIVPILEYCCTVWDPHILKDIDRIDRIQKRAARLIIYGPSVIDLINDLKCLQTRKTNLKIVMMCKI